MSTLIYDEPWFMAKQWFMMIGEPCLWWTLVYGNPVYGDPWFVETMIYGIPVYGNHGLWRTLFMVNHGNYESVHCNRLALSAFDLH